MIDIKELLTSIASDLDTMLTELCQTFPRRKPAPEKKVVQPTQHTCPHWVSVHSIFPPKKTRHRMGMGEEDSEDNEDNTVYMRQTKPTAPLPHRRSLIPQDDQSNVSPSWENVRYDSPANMTLQNSPAPPGDDIRNIPMLERLIRTQTIWYQPNMSRVGAIHLLQNKAKGIFLVRKSSHGGVMALSLRVGTKPAVDHYLIESRARGLRLEGSYHHFSAIPVLIAYYCENLDELPVKLVLPQTLMETTSNQELTAYALLGQDFWTSASTIHKISSESSMQMNIPVTPCDRESSKVTLVPVTPKMASPVIESSAIGSEMKTTTVITAKHESVCHHKTVLKTFSQTQATCTSVKSVQNSCDVKKTVVKSVSDNSLRKESRKCVLQDMKSPDYDNLEEDVKVESRPASDVKIVVPTPHRATPDGKIHSRPSPSTNQKDPSLLAAKYCYYGSSLADKLSDYEDIWNGSMKKNNQKGKKSENVQPQKKHNQAIKKEKLNLSIINPGYQSDSGSEKNSPTMEEDNDNNNLEIIDIMQVPYRNQNCRKPKEVPPDVFNSNLVNTKTKSGAKLASQDARPNLQGSHARLNSHRRSAFEPVKTSTAAHGEVLPSVCKVSSSPGYKEPVDSLIGKIEGVSNTEGALKVRDTISHSALKRLSLVETVSTSNAVTQTENGHAGAVDAKMQRTLHRTMLAQQCHRDPAVEQRCQSLEPCRRRVIKPLEITGCLSKRSQSVECIPEAKVPTQCTPQPVYTRRSEERNVTPVKPFRLGKPPKGKRHQHMISDFDNNRKVHMKSDCNNVNQCSNMNGHAHDLGSERPLLRKFPVFQSQSSVASNMSESSTIEDIISSMSPDLTVHPIQPLTHRNLQRISEYDNLGLSGMPSHRTASSVGTYYCTPWDKSIWHDILKKGPPNIQTTVPNVPSSASSIPQSRQSPSPSDGSNCPETPDQGYGGTSQDVPMKREHRSPTPEQKSCQEEDVQCVDDQENMVAIAIENLDVSDDEGVEEENIDAEKDDFIIEPTKHFQAYRDAAPQLRQYLYELAKNDRNTFGGSVQNFIQCTREGTETNPQAVMRNVRQFMNGIKNYLIQHGEPGLNSVIEQERKQLRSCEFLNVDAIIEGALHRIIIRPLKKHIYRLFVHEYKRKGMLQLLSENIRHARSMSPQELGIKRGILLPQGSSLELIRQLLLAMQKAYSPLVKLENLLAATSTIFTSVQVSSTYGKEVGILGADDFLPIFVYVLVQTGLVAAEIEADYMWGLLHPSLLVGEGCYYLTALSSAVNVLRNLHKHGDPNQQQQLIARSSSLSGLHGFMKIVMPDEQNASIITHTLPVRPNMTTKDISSMIAHKFNITNSQDCGLYLLVDGSEESLEDNQCPQTMKEKLTIRGHHCVFAYKRRNAKFLWPTSFSKESFSK